MKRRWSKIFLSTIVAFVLFGCAGTEGIRTRPSLLPTYIRKIAVRPISNKTTYFGLEDKLRLEIEQEFLRDGRLAYVNKEDEADGVVAGVLTRYIKEPITYNSDHVVIEFKIWVIMDLKFIDRVNNQLLWEEPSLDQEQRYFVETEPGGITEEEAREDLWRLFAQDIVKRTIEGFGTVTGASQRKVPDSAPTSQEPVLSTGTVVPDRPRPAADRTAPLSPYPY